MLFVLQFSMKAMNLIGMLMTLLVLSGKVLGVSPSLRYMYAATVPGNVACLQYDWWRYGGLNLLFVAGILLGGVVAGFGCTMSTWTYK